MISLKDKEKIAKLAYIWCLGNLKKSRYHEEPPKFFVRSSKNSNSFKGYYKEKNNLIAIFPRNHRSVLDLCETVIHEWKHYQQNIIGMYDRYETVYRRKGKNHPYEITAEKYAYKHGLACRKWVKEMMDNK